MDFDDWEKQGERVYFFLTRITHIHLDSHAITEFEQNGDRSYIYMLLCIACFILILACLNFINLTTARASNRAKEVGIRKAIGAVQKKLIAQFMGESFIYTCLALLFGLALVAFTLSSFNELTTKNFYLEHLTSPKFIAGHFVNGCNDYLDFRELPGFHIVFLCTVTRVKRKEHSRWQATQRRAAPWWFFNSRCQPASSWPP